MNEGDEAADDAERKDKNKDPHAETQ